MLEKCCRKVLDTQIQGRLKYLIRDKQNEYCYQIREVETQPDVHLILESTINIPGASNGQVDISQGFRYHRVNDNEIETRS